MERLTHERVSGIKTGYWSAEKKETLIARLAEYENTRKTPEEIKDFESVAKDMAEQVVKLFNRLEEERSKHRWIPMSESLPDAETWVLATVKRHRWICDYKENVPDEWKVDHPESLYVTLAKRNAEGWWYIDMECDSLSYDLNPEDYEGKEDLSCPRVEVLAWMPLPEAHKNDEKGKDNEEQRTD